MHPCRRYDIVYVDGTREIGVAARYLRRHQDVHTSSQRRSSALAPSEEACLRCRCEGGPAWSSADVAQHLQRQPELSQYAPAFRTEQASALFDAPNALEVLDPALARAVVRELGVADPTHARLVLSLIAACGHRSAPLATLVGARESVDVWLEHFDWLFPFALAVYPDAERDLISRQITHLKWPAVGLGNPRATHRLGRTASGPDPPRPVPSAPLTALCSAPTALCTLLPLGVLHSSYVATS